jgi:hypothetical protein
VGIRPSCTAVRVITSTFLLIKDTLNKMPMKTFMNKLVKKIWSSWKVFLKLRTLTMLYFSLKKAMT